ncbi:hypothetical protein [Thermostichus vulcanus]|uniref:Uncharacterized protein n=1 Tax=Thermostichus vulcanus str. 'Rupite' TaxID=2813851 RepID=A0ABT0CFV3_THEVL|nr:hypothetical protein [Thermostichus vulcanus]MCJ2544651.1 hypothetical protein [Thermostichus vulcanus str. 'Rupite']
MVFPTIRVPQLLLFVEAASLLQDSSQVLLQAGQAAADLPELIAAAQARAETQLEPLGIPADLRAQVYGILRLTPPQLVLADLQDLVDNGSGPDVEAFLEQVGSASTLLRFPPALVGSVALGLLLERLDFSTEEAEALRTNRAQLEQTLAELASHYAIDLEPLRTATEIALQPASPEELVQLGQDLWAVESEAEPEPQLELAGPLLFMMVADHLLAMESVLTPEQRLDLQTNRGQAETRYLAMQKLGRIENLAEQQAYIQAWIDQTPPADLLRALDQLFAVLEVGS